VREREAICRGQVKLETFIALNGHRSAWSVVENTTLILRKKKKGGPQSARTRGKRLSRNKILWVLIQIVETQLTGNRRREDRR